jgi:hypothetical protein
MSKAAEPGGISHHWLAQYCCHQAEVVLTDSGIVVVLKC